MLALAVTLALTLTPALTLTLALTPMKCICSKYEYPFTVSIIGTDSSEKGISV